MQPMGKSGVGDCLKLDVHLDYQLMQDAGGKVAH